MNRTLISHASIFVPFLLGHASALWLYSGYAGEGATFPTFALFLGISMSITAFPVLARIIQERGLTGTTIGVTAVACGGVRPLLARRMASLPEAAQATRNDLIWPLIIVLVSALVTEAIGIHGLFGAFLAGVVMPQRGPLRRFLSCCRPSSPVRACMNTRGLMELIALNLGLELGVLSPKLFTMLVLMALITIFGAGPLLHLLGVGERTRAGGVAVDYCVRKSASPKSVRKTLPRPSLMMFAGLGSRWIRP